MKSIILLTWDDPTKLLPFALASLCLPFSEFKAKVQMGNLRSVSQLSFFFSPRSLPFTPGQMWEHMRAPTHKVCPMALVQTKSVHNFLCVGGPDGIKTNLALVPRPFGDGLEDKAWVQVARSPLCHGFLSFWRGFDWKKARVGPRQETWLPDPNPDAVHFWWPPLRLKSPSRSF